MMLTFRGHRYMGNDGEYQKAIQDAIEDFERRLKQMEAQSKTETRGK